MTRSVYGLIRVQPRAGEPEHQRAAILRWASLAGYGVPQWLDLRGRAVPKLLRTLHADKGRPLLLVTSLDMVAWSPLHLRRVLKYADIVTVTHRSATLGEIVDQLAIGQWTECKPRKRGRPVKSKGEYRALLKGYSLKHPLVAEAQRLGVSPGTIHYAVNRIYGKGKAGPLRRYQPTAGRTSLRERWKQGILQQREEANGPDDDRDNEGTTADPRSGAVSGGAGEDVPGLGCPGLDGPMDAGTRLSGGVQVATGTPRASD